MTAASSHPAYHDPAVIERVLADSSVWAVVGLGDNRTRAAYSVAKFLQAHGMVDKVVPRDQLKGFLASCLDWMMPAKA